MFPRGGGKRMMQYITAYINVRSSLGQEKADEYLIKYVPDQLHYQILQKCR